MFSRGHQLDDCPSPPDHPGLRPMLFRKNPMGWGTQRTSVCGRAQGSVPSNRVLGVGRRTVTTGGACCLGLVMLRYSRLETEALFSLGQKMPSFGGLTVWNLSDSPFWSLTKKAVAGKMPRLKAVCTGILPCNIYSARIFSFVEPFRACCCWNRFQGFTGTVDAPELKGALIGPWMVLWRNIEACSTLAAALPAA